MFEKVIGYEEIKEELSMIVDYLNNPEKYKALGVKKPNGLLLHGCPGIGKTSLATEFIKEVKGYDHTILRNEKSIERITDYISNVFENAKNSSDGHIILIDDFDKFASDGDQTAFATVQACIDDIKESKVFVVATANNIRIIPNSLKRVGRFDHVIKMNNPRKCDAEKIIEHYLKKKKCDKTVNPKKVTKLLAGNSCALLETVINEAGIYAAFDNRRKISMNDLIKSFMRFINEAPSTNSSSNGYKEEVAYHEAGHAVVAEILEPGSVSFVSIKGNLGSTEGFTCFDWNEDYWKDKVFADNRAKTLLAGKATAEIVFGKVDIGASEDLNRAYNVIHRFNTAYAENGFACFCGKTDASEQLTYDQEKLNNQMLSTYYSAVRNLLIQNRTFLDKVAKALVEKEILFDEDIKAIREECLV